MTPQTDTPLVGGVTQAPKSGLFSTEFGVTIASVLGIVLGAVPQQYAPLVAAIAGVYVAARTLLKVVHALGYAANVPDLPALPAGSTVTNVTTTQVPKV